MLFGLPTVALRGGDRCHRSAAVGHNAVPERQDSGGLGHGTASDGRGATVPVGSHACASACTLTWAGACVCNCMHVRVHACKCECVHKQLCAHRDARARVHLYTHICMCIHTLEHRHTRACTFVHSCTDMFAPSTCTTCVFACCALRCACTTPHTAHSQQPSALKSRGNFSSFCWRTGLGAGAAAAGTARPRRR